MKLTSIILLGICLQVAASGVSQNVTLNVKSTPLKKVFDVIEFQTGYLFFYQSDLLNKSKPVTLNINNMEIREALNLCLSGQPIQYNINGKSILLKEFHSNTASNVDLSISPPLNVKGRIINEMGEPIAGASVQVKGDNEKGTSTDDNGYFELSAVEDSSILVISGVNLETVEIEVRGKALLNAIMVKKQIKEGEEIQVVSTGYQKIPTERATGSFSFIDGPALNRSVGGNIIDRMEGMASGVLLFNSLQQSLNDRQNIRIRSRNTILSDATPLIVLDNFPYEGEISNINPDDIASITILKDASASSIWGARASNGVIVLTSKSGKFQQPVKVSLNSNIDFRAKQDFYLVPTINTSDLIDIQTDLYTKGAYLNTINSSSRLSLPEVVDILLDRDAGNISEATANQRIDLLRSNDIRKDLEKYFYQQPVFHRHALNISGGGNNNNFYLSAGWDKNLDAQVGNAYSRITINAKNNFYFLDKKLELGTDIRVFQTSTDRNAESYFAFNIYDRLADDEGNSNPVSRWRRSYIDTAGGGRLLDWNYRPLDELKQRDYNTTQLEYLTGLQLKYAFTPAFDIQAYYRIERTINQVKNYDAAESYIMRDLINRFSSIDYSTGQVSRQVPIGGRLFQQTLLGKRHYGRVMLHVGKAWNGEHLFDMVAGGDISSSRQEGDGSYYYGYRDGSAISVPVNYATLYRTFINGSSQSIPNNISITGITNRAVDLFANASYSYRGKYTLTASARQDGANIYGVSTNQQWVPLWHTGFKWDIYKEKFFQIPWISSLKLRATYGYVGNSNNSLSAYLTTLTRSANNYNVPYAEIASPPNPNLRWEKTGNTNIAIDAGLIKDRVRFTVEYYRNKSVDLFGEAPVDPTTGQASFRGNVAVMKGNGIDISVQSDNLSGQLKWTTSLTLSKASDIITRYYFPINTQNGLVNQSGYREGKPVNAIYSYKWAGLTVTGDPAGYLEKEISTDYRAISNSTDLDDAVFHGSSVPVWSGSILNTLKLGNIELSFLIIYKGNYFFRKNSNLSASGALNGIILSSDYYLRWQQPGDEQRTIFPSVIYPENTQRSAFFTFSEVMKDRADHIRLQDIRIAYELFKKRIPWLPVRRIQFYGRVSNVGLLWKANRWGVDPELSQYPTLAGANYGRNFAAGISVDL